MSAACVGDVSRNRGHRMSFGWKKITANVWRLDDTWQVVQETPGQWRVYRGDQSTGFVFATVDAAMEKAERLKKEGEGIA